MGQPAEGSRTVLIQGFSMLFEPIHNLDDRPYYIPCCIVDRKRV